MEARRTTPCPHCEAEQTAEARFCSSCGKALPTGWGEPRSFTHNDGSSLGVGFELREALLALEAPSGCARWFFGVMFGLGMLGAVSTSIAYRLPAVQQVAPPILLGIVWIETIAVFGLWVWSRTQPYAAALTGFILYLTGAVIGLFGSLPMLESVPLIVIVIQVVINAGFLWVVYKVVRSSRNPLGRSKLSTRLAAHPVALEPAPAALRENLAVREGVGAEEAPVVPAPDEGEDLEEPASGRPSHEAGAASALAALKRRSVELARTSDDRLPAWLRPLSLRVFQAAVVVVVIYQLNRAATVFTGPRGKLFPFRSAVLLAPVVALADVVIAAIASFQLIKGLAKLFGDPVVDRDYWLKHLPRLAMMLGGLVVLRILSIVAALFTEHARFGSPNGDFFIAMFIDIALVVLCFVGRRLWKNPTFPGKP